MPASQKRLLFFFALFLIAQAALNLGKYFVEVRDGARFGGDFIVFWQTAQQAAAGDTKAIYATDKLTGEDISTLITNPERDTGAPFIYPPHALPLLLPLGFLSYNAAAALWSIPPIVFFYLLLFKLFSLRQREKKLQLIIATSALPMLSANLFSGQSGTWMAVLFLLAAYSWTRSKALSGMALGLLTVKPQLGILWPFILIATRQWRIIAIAITASAALCAVVTLWLGMDIWHEYLRAAPVFTQYINEGFARAARLSLSPFLSLHTIGVPFGVAAAVQALITLAMVVMVVKLKPQEPFFFGLLACAALLATPYSLVYDSPLLMLAVAPLLIRAWEERWRSAWEMAAVVLILFMPFAAPVLIAYRVPFGCISLLFFLGVLWRRRLVENT